VGTDPQRGAADKSMTDGFAIDHPDLDKILYLDDVTTANAWC
jgi:hypothetical protein